MLRDLGLLERAWSWMESRMEMDVYREALAVIYGKKWPSKLIKIGIYGSGG